MSFFTPLVRNQLVNQFWNLEPVHCPHDGFKLDTFFQSQIAGYLLVLVCGRCGRKAQITRFSDPQRVLFRAWTPRETATLAAAHKDGAAPACPVCHAAIEPRPGPASALDSVQCLRCGNQYSRLAQPAQSACA